MSFSWLHVPYSQCLVCFADDVEGWFVYGKLETVLKNKK